MEGLDGERVAELSGNLSLITLFKESEVPPTAPRSVPL